LLAYAFLRDKSASLPTAEGYAWTRLIVLPRQARFVEFAAVAGLVAVVMLRRISSAAATLLGGCTLFSAFALLAYLANPLAGLSDFLVASFRGMGGSARLRTRPRCSERDRHRPQLGLMSGARLVRASHYGTD
jgi:hypothetical protein